MDRSIYNKFSLSYLITKCARAILKEYEKEMIEFEISPLQGGVLYVIAENSPINQTQIAKLLFIDKVTLSKMMFKLEGLELISEVKTQDRRSKYWEITQQGKKTLKKVNEIDSRLNKVLLKELTAEGFKTEDIEQALRSLLFNR